MGIVFKNNAKTTLGADLNDSATSATVADGSVFPSLGSGEFFFCTFDDGTNNEIVKVTGRSSNTLTIVRAQDNTSARSFSTGDDAQLRVTAATLEQFMENWVLEDDDGTEVTVSNAQEVKFIGSGITTNWTDTSNGSDGDPYDLTFSIDAAQTNITSILATDLKIGEDDQTKIDFESADEIHFYAANAEQVFVSDGVFGPQTDSDVDLGTTSARFKDAFVDSITVTGEVDGASLDISGDADIDGTLEADAITVNGTALDEFISDTTGGMFSSNTETGITATYQDADNTIDLALDASQTVISSILNASLVIGRDADNDIDFGTDNNMIFRVNAEDQVVLKDGVFEPVTDDNVDLGSSSKKFKDAFIDGTLDLDNLKVAGAQGSDGQVLTSTGAGVQWENAAGGGTTINNNANNRLITGSDTADTLEGEANATWNGNTLALTAGAGNTGISLTDGSTNYGFIAGGNALKSGGSANDFSFRTDTGSIDFYTNGQNLRFAIESDGRIFTSDNVTMGTQTRQDNATLTVLKGGSNGDPVVDLNHDTGDASFYRFMKFRKKSESSAVGRLDADITGSAMTLSFDSDGRYKDVLGDADGLNLISKLNPIKFKWKDGTGEGSQGFIAQDFKKAFEDIGSYARGVYEPEDESKEKWQLDYNTLVPNLVKAIQEQQEQIEILQNEVEQLKGEK